MRVKLVHKISALILIPFLFNGLCLLLLNDAVARKDQMVQAERAQAKYLEDLNHGVQLFYDSTGKLFEYELTDDPAARRHSIDSLNMLRELISRMRLDAAVSPSTKQGFESFAQTMESVTTSIAQDDLTAQDNTTPFFKRVNAARKLLKKSLKSSSFILNAINEKQRNLDRLREDEKQQDENVVKIVLGGFAGNLMLVIVFFYFIATDFSKRLAILVTNSLRLGKRLPLTAAPSGQDELNALDAAMRKAAADLQEAFEFRASLMEMVAHDLRSPLQSMQASLETLTEAGAERLDEKEVLQVDRLHANNSRLLALVEDLLTVDRLDAGALELNLSPVNVRAVATESILLMGGLAMSADVRVVNNCSDLTVMADARRLAQVFNNLLANAIKFSPADSEVQVSSRVEGRRAVVSITDQGEGMTEEHLQHVFEKFFQVDGPRKHQGSGLGLAICKLIIDSHSGRIGVESEPGKGSRFWFSLLRAEQ
jgi:signal transduction histidine kinase